MPVTRKRKQKVGQTSAKQAKTEPSKRRTRGRARLDAEAEEEEEGKLKLHVQDHVAVRTQLAEVDTITPRKLILQYEFEKLQSTIEEAHQHADSGTLDAWVKDAVTSGRLIRTASPEDSNAMLSSPLLPSIPSVSQQDLPEADVEDSETNSAPGVDEMGLEDRAGISVVVRVHHREEAAIQPTTLFEATNDDSAPSPEYRCADIADLNSHIGSRIITWREESDGNNVTPIPELGPEAALAETRRGGTALEASESPAPSAPATNKDFFNNAIPDVGEVSSLDQETPVFSPSLGDAVRLQDASTVLNGDQIAASSMVSLQDKAETKDTAQDDILMEAQPTTFVEAESLAEDEDHLLHDKISSSPHNETEPSAFTKAGYLKLQEEVEHLRSSVQVIREELSLLKTMSAYSAELEGLRTRNAEYQALLTVTRTQALSLADTLRSLETQVDKKDD